MNGKTKYRESEVCRIFLMKDLIENEKTVFSKEEEE